MEKTKLGLSVSVMGVVLTLLGYYAGYVITGLAVAWVLLQEENEGLKKHAVRVLFLMLLFSVGSTAIGLIPDVVNLVLSFLRLFNVHVYIDVLDSCFNFLYSVWSLLRLAVFAILAVGGLTKKEIKIPVIDKLAEKIL